MIILKRACFQTSGEFDSAILAAKHREDGLDVIPRAGEKIVVEDIMAVVDWERIGLRPFPPYIAEPTPPWTAPGSDCVPWLDVAARDELKTRVPIGDAADLDRGDEAPLLGQPFSDCLIGRERDADVDFISLGEKVGRPKVRKFVIRRRLVAAREHANNSRLGHCTGLHHSPATLNSGGM